MYAAGACGSGGVVASCQLLTAVGNWQVDVGGAFPLLETVILRFRGLVHHVGREIVDVCFAMLCCTSRHCMEVTL